MIHPRRNPSVLLGAVCLAAFVAPTPATLQEIDNRPIYYVMVKSLEEGFQAYNAALAEEVKTREANLRARYESDRAAVAAEIAALDSERSAREATYNADREALNRQIDSVNDRIAVRDGRINEERRIQKRHAPRYADDPRIKELKESVAAHLARLKIERTDYLERQSTIREARRALTRQFEEYMSAGDPLALEIRSLDEDWQRFAEGERRKLKSLADAYAVDYAAYEKWLEAERAVLEEMGTGVAAALVAEREQRALHASTETELRALIDEYNALVDVHNAAGPADPGRDARAQQFANMEDRIAELQAVLAGARDVVITINEELTRKHDEFNAQYERFAAKKRERDALLAADLSDLNASRLTVETAIDERRRKVDAQIKSLEAHISGELEDSRDALESVSAEVIASYGRDHEGLDTAITRVIESGDDSLLYSPDGTPHFDLSRPRTAAIYTAVERLDADRRRIDARIATIEESEGGAQPAATAQTVAAGKLEQEQATLTARRQQLLESHASFAREIQTKAGALEKRRRTVDATFAADRAALGELYSARAGVTRAEMQAVQDVLVSAARGLPGAGAASGDHGVQLEMLRSSAGAAGEKENAALLAPHALMEHIGDRVPEAGAGESPEWQSFAARKVRASRELGGADKVAFAYAWLARFREQADFRDVASALDRSGAVADGRDTLSTLFLTGVIDHSEIVEQRLDDDGLGFQVDILDRVYQLDPAGSLEKLPSG